MKHLALVVALVTAACTTTAPLPATATVTATAHATTSGSGVFVNGQELGASDKAEFDALVGESVPPGRYAIDAQGNLGYEGQPPVVNLADLQQRQQLGKPFEMHGDDSHIVSEGGCTILSTPSGSLSSGC